MTYPTRTLPTDLILPPAARRVSPRPPAEPQPVTPLESLVAWLATVGLLILLAAGTLVAFGVWFAALFFAEPHPDEAAGE